jgi:hypothetical protein
MGGTYLIYFSAHLSSLFLYHDYRSSSCRYAFLVSFIYFYFIFPTLFPTFYSLQFQHSNAACSAKYSICLRNRSLSIILFTLQKRLGMIPALTTAPMAPGEISNTTAAVQPAAAAVSTGGPASNNTGVSSSGVPRGLIAENKTFFLFLEPILPQIHNYLHFLLTIPLSRWS